MKSKENLNDTPGRREKETTVTSGETAPVRGSGYRLRGLDGLRAIAASAVLLYHLFPLTISGGYLGVDIFFVLSGFLITALLVSEKMRFGRIRLGRFWLRRFRRLYPAVVLAICVLSPIAYLTDPDLLAGGRRQIISGLSYTFNWAEIYHGSDYFDKGFPELFKNLWTLAVEQQFYLLWPLLIVALPLGRLVITREEQPQIRPERKNLLLPLTLAASSFLAFALLYPGSANRAYMGTDTHLFGLMLGAALAIFLENPLAAPREKTTSELAAFPGKICRQLRAFIAAISLILMLIICVYARDDSSLPYWSLAVCLCTLGVIQGLVGTAQGKSPSALGKILDLKPLRYLGERSYGLYLWHWPVLIIAKALFPGTQPVLFALAVLVISLGAAALSYRWVETPIRRYGGRGAVKRCRIRKVRTVAVGAIVLLLGAGLGFSLIKAPAVSSLKLAQEQAAREAKNAQALSVAKAEEAKKIPQVKPQAQVKGENITIIGDSVTQMGAAALNQTWPGAIVDGLKNRAALHGQELLEHYANSGGLRHYVVVSLTNNGAFPPEYVQQWLELIGEERILILVTGFGPEQSQWIFNNNQTIRQLQATYPEKIVIAEWDKLIAPHQDLLYLDLVHPRPEGEYLYIEAIKNALEHAQYYPQSLIDAKNAKFPAEVQAQIDQQKKARQQAEKKKAKQASKDPQKPAKLKKAE